MPIAETAGRNLRVGRSELPAIGILVLGSAAFATSNVASKLALDRGVAVGMLVVSRFVIGGATLWVIAATFGWLRDVPLRRRLELLALGVGLTTQATFLIEAFARIPAATATLLLYTYPAIITVLGLMLRWEPPGRMKTLALVVSSGGTALVLGAPVGSLRPLGAALALAAAFLLAVNTLIASRLIADIPPFTAASHVILGAGLSSLLVAFPAGWLQNGLGGAEVALLIWVGLSASVLGPVAVLGALARLGPSRTAIGSTFEPLATVLLAAVLLGERLGAWQLGGGLLVVSAITLLPVIKARWTEGDPASEVDDRGDPVPYPGAHVPAVPAVPRGDA